MESGLFLSTTITGLIEFIRSVGLIPSVLGAAVVIFYGVWYVTIKRRMETNQPTNYSLVINLASRIALGLILFVVGGLNGFFQFLPEHPSSLQNDCGQCQVLLQGIMSTGYMFPFVKATELIVGLMLLAGFFVPLALVLIAPIVLNIAMYHFFLDTTGIPIAILLLGLQLILTYQYRDAFKSILSDVKWSSDNKTMSGPVGRAVQLDIK